MTSFWLAETNTMSTKMMPCSPRNHWAGHLAQAVQKMSLIFTESVLITCHGVRCHSEIHKKGLLVLAKASQKCYL